MIKMNIALFHIIFDSIFLVVLFICVTILIFHLKIYILSKWIEKSVNAAEVLFCTSDSEYKKLWVIDFLKCNGLTKGISDSMLDTLIDVEINNVRLRNNIS